MFCDRLTTLEDQNLYYSQISTILNETYGDHATAAMEQPSLFGDFEFALQRIQSEGQLEDARLYKDMGGYDEVRKLFSGMLEEYSNNEKPMTLVLFEAALEHICRIHRIIRNPRGNALLVGGGGSGKQSLTRLASYSGSIRSTEPYRTTSRHHQLLTSNHILT